MLGWEFYVIRQADVDHHDREAEASRLSLATWRAGLGGTRWLNDLVTRGVAFDRGGTGYPHRYEVRAGVLLAAISHGIPKHTGPLVIGDDYVTPPGWMDDVRIDADTLRALDPHEVLVVEAWDQS
jgi:hypothetical protein